MVILSLLSGFLLAKAALSTPSTIGASLKSQPLQRVRDGNVVAGGTLGQPQVLVSNNWSGSAWNKTQGTFKAVSGTFVVPKLSAPEGYSSAWVGIDGFTCQTAILQTGIQFNFLDNTSTYRAWYEWYPAEAFYFDGITIEAGDEVRATVAAYSPTSGKAVIENLTKGQSVEQDLNSTFPLCGEDAEWIVEDFSYNNGTLVPLNDFGTVKFEEAFALTADREFLTPDNATVILLRQNHKIITSVDEEVLQVTVSYNATSTTPSQS